MVEQLNEEPVEDQEEEEEQPERGKNPELLELFKTVEAKFIKIGKLDKEVTAAE